MRSASSAGDGVSCRRLLVAHTANDSADVTVDVRGKKIVARTPVPGRADSPLAATCQPPFSFVR
jgi:hypothetical protein